MHFSFDVAGPTNPQPAQPVPNSVPADQLELLRQILEVQKEQLMLTRAVAIANDSGHRWRNFLAKWGEHYPDLSRSCKEVLPYLERALLEMMTDLSDRLQDEGPDAIDNEFTLSEFLDRYGMKINQLGTILNLVTPLAEAVPPPQPAATEDAKTDDGGS